MTTNPCLTTACLLLSIGATAAQDAPAPPQAAPIGEVSFRLTLDPDVQASPYSGRVFVVVSENLERPPRMAMGNWFKPPWILAKEIGDLPVGTPVVLDKNARAYLTPLSELPAGTYHLQAVARRSLDHPVPGRGPGDLYSLPRSSISKPVALRPCLSDWIRSPRLDHSRKPSVSSSSKS